MLAYLRSGFFYENYSGYIRITAHPNIYNPYSLALTSNGAHSIRNIKTFITGGFYA